MNQKKSYNKSACISRYYDQLEFKAGQLIGYLADRSIYGKRALFKEYMVKVQIIKNHENYGYLVIYYSPKKMKYTLVTNEIRDKEMQGYLEELWVRMNNEAIRKVSNNVHSL